MFNDKRITRGYAQHPHPLKSIHFEERPKEQRILVSVGLSQESHKSILYQVTDYAVGTLLLDKRNRW
jgi:hypothetical protein